jgi:hypothetical protein
MTRPTLWRVSGYVPGEGGKPWTWRMCLRDRLRAWFHRHICADDANSDRLDALDRELKRREGR